MNMNHTKSNKPILIMSYDYDDWVHSPNKIREVLHVFKEAGYDRVHWRIASGGGFLYRSKKVRCAEARLDALGGPLFDPLAYGTEYAHKIGMQVYSYIDCWENIGPIGEWGREHPEFCMMTRDGERWTNGISYAYPESRAFRSIPIEETAALGVDGIYLENFSWHAGGAPTEWIGFEPPVVRMYKKAYNVDILTQPFVLSELKKVQGLFFKEFLMNVRSYLKSCQKISFSYPFSQSNCMYHLPILDLKELIAEGIIDELILGVWFGDDYEAWLTREGYMKAVEMSDFCHQHGRQFIAYIYTDFPYFYTFKRYGSYGVRNRFRDDIAWLMGTGVDGFSNRNVPEMLTNHGSPAPGDIENVSEYFIPAGIQLWSGASEGIEAEAGYYIPPWIVSGVDCVAPSILAVIPRSNDLTHYPEPHYADFYPETYKGMIRQYKNLFELLGFRIEFATEQSELDEAINHNMEYTAIVFGHDCFKGNWLSEWVKSNGGKLIDDVKKGLALIAETGRGSEDLPIGHLLGVSEISSCDDVNLFLYDHEIMPEDMKGYLPKELDVYKNAINIFQYEKSRFCTKAYNQSTLPDWAKAIVSKPTNTNKNYLPIMIAGELGKGKIICSTTCFLSPEFITINPQDGPIMPEVIRLWQAIGHWLIPGRDLPIDKAISFQDERHSRMGQNLLANGSFEEGTINGYPAFWMAKGRNSNMGWLKVGDSINVLDRNGNGHYISLETDKVEEITSMGVPIDPEKEYVLSGMIRSEGFIPVEQIGTGMPYYINILLEYSTREFMSISGMLSLEHKTTNEWKEAKLKFGPLKSGMEQGPYKAWVKVTLPKRHPNGGEGIVHLDEFCIKAI
jgi:Uncharacterised BCR, COG1649.